MTLSAWAQSNPTAAQQITTPKINTYFHHAPSYKQTLLLLCNHVREVLYGGAAGGGKSDGLLMAALQFVDVPQYAALILRRTYADLSLPGALMDRAMEWLHPTDAHWSDKTKTWTFPSGATLTFGYLETERDKYRYQSSEFQYIAFDELTQFTESQYTYLFSRLRKGDDNPVPLRMRSGTNPGGVGHNWVKDRFIDSPNTPQRIFIPSSLDDNPGLNKQEYRESLRELDMVTRKRLEDGNWRIQESGNKFKREWFKIVDSTPRLIRTVRYWDLAATEPSESNPDPDYTCGVKMAIGEDDNIYILDVQLKRAGSHDIETLVRHTASVDGEEVIIGIEQEPGSSGKSVIEYYRKRVLSGYALRANRPTGDKVVRANPLSARVEAGDVHLMRGSWNTAYLDMLNAFPNPAVHDDAVDASSGAWDMLKNTVSTIPLVSFR